MIVEGTLLYWPKSMLYLPLSKGQQKILSGVEFHAPMASRYDELYPERKPGQVGMVDMPVEALL